MCSQLRELDVKLNILASYNNLGIASKEFVAMGTCTSGLHDSLFKDVVRNTGHTLDVNLGTKREGLP